MRTKIYILWLAVCGCAQSSTEKNDPQTQYVRVERADYRNDSIFFKKEYLFDYLDSDSNVIEYDLKTLIESLDMNYTIPAKEKLTGKDTITEQSDTTKHPLLRTYYTYIYNDRGKLSGYEVNPPQQRDTWWWFYDSNGRPEKIKRFIDSVQVKYSLDGKIKGFDFWQYGVHRKYKITYPALL